MIILKRHTKYESKTLEYEKTSRVGLVMACGHEQHALDEHDRDMQDAI